MTSEPRVNLFESLPLTTITSLAYCLDPAPDSFTLLLLYLIARSDPDQLARIRAGFPTEVRLFEAWRSASPVPTWQQLLDKTTTPPDVAYAQAKAAVNDMAKGLGLAPPYDS